MRNSPIYRLLISCLAVALIAGLLAVPGNVLAEGGGATEPPLQLTGDSLKDSTGSYGSTTTSGGEGTIGSSVALEALLLIMTTL